MLPVLLLFTACDSGSDYSPRPRGFYRITYPEHTYTLFDPADCPYRFEIPKTAIAMQDSNASAEKCWYYFLIPQLNAQVYLTYKEISNNFNQYAEDTRTLVYKHTSRASSIDEEVISFHKGVSGVIYEIGGNAASQIQFYMTDSTKHFLRGALYFNIAPNADSLKPSIAYMREDIRHMLQTLSWK